MPYTVVVRSTERARLKRVSKVACGCEAFAESLVR